MSEHIRIRRGLDIPLTGEAQQYVAKTLTSGVIAMRTSDFRGLKAAALVSEGEQVITGQPVFCDYARREIVFCSPVCGVVTGLSRGDDGVLSEVRISSEGPCDGVRFAIPKPAALQREEIIDLMLRGGMWPCIRQRPYGIIANPYKMPYSIFISAFSSAPLAPDMDYALSEDMADIQLGIDMLSKLTRGGIHLCLPVKNFAGTDFHKLRGVVKHSIYGPHPAGNVGVQINRISPLSEGDIIWTVDLFHVAAIGRFFQRGRYDMHRLVAVVGPAALNPSYVDCVPGAAMADLEDHFDRWQGDLRIISGDVLSGRNVGRNGYLGFYDNMVTVLREGEGRESFGWAKPLRFDRYSSTRHYLSRLLGSHKFEMDTLLNGSKRPFVMGDAYRRVFPMDIYPVELFKAILAGDRDRMEKLGIAEVVEEDVALCEYVCPSKIDIQAIVTKGIDMMLENWK